MTDRPSDRTYRLELDDQVHELAWAPYRVFLCDLVSRLLVEKEASRASFLLAAPEGELDEMSAHLFRHLRQQRCTGPDYARLDGHAESFRIHSVVDALVAVHFFLRAGAIVPHFFVGHDVTDVVCCLDRGYRTRIAVGKPELLGRIRELIPSTAG